MNKRVKRLAFISGSLLFVYTLLLIPDSNDSTIIRAHENPFVWNKDSLWNQLEKDFKNASLQPKHINDSIISILFSKEQEHLVQINLAETKLTDTAYRLLLTDFFTLASYVAAQKEHLGFFLKLYNNARLLIKERSRNWPMDDRQVRSSVYQLLYGMRAAVEEVLLQTKPGSYQQAMYVKEEFSVTPSTTIFGMKVHSGDLLVSRGEAEVSALISRGNDYPANFSHVALVYVDATTLQPYLIEAHIEKGVAISSVQQYEQDKKLRFMVLRLRNDLPQINEDNMLPHKAAKFAYEQAYKKHIPYDFKMDIRDSTALFCSEVASYAYKKQGIILWKGVSTISSQGVVNWLHDFGVENFVTQMPGDLEYDPQLSVVAEWRNKETLLKDHLDNAVMDVLLEQADAGVRIQYNKWLLPFVRIVKGWCLVKNMFGYTGIIPEGMSATRALKNQYFVKMYKDLRVKTEKMVEHFTREKKYTPPYWQMISLARQAVNN